MTKSEIASELAHKTGLSKVSATAAYEAFVELIQEQLASGNNVALHGFGTFKVTERPARTARNPRTGESMQVKAKKAVKFSPASALKNAVDKA